MAGKRDSGQDQCYAREHHCGDVLAEDQDAEHDRDHRQEVGHRRCDGRALAGDDLVVQDVGDAVPTMPRIATAATLTAVK
jgi:hypothetical protein